MVDLSSTDEVVIESCRIVSAPHVDRALEIDDPYNKPVPKVQYMKMSGTTRVGNLNKGGLVLGPNTAPTLQEFLDALAQGLEFPVDY